MSDEPRLLRDHVGDNEKTLEYLRGVQCLRSLTPDERKLLDAHEQEKKLRAKEGGKKKWRGSKPSGTSSKPSRTRSEPTP